jgi:predicted phage tail protein
LCEGPIEGFAGSSTARSIYLNDTPLEDAQGRLNFSDNVQVSFTNGTLSQGVISGFNDVQIEQSVGNQLTKSAGPISVTTTRNDLTRVIVRIAVGPLYIIDANDGEFESHDVEFDISIVDFLGNNIANRRIVISGKARAPTDFEYEFILSGTGPWTVRVERESSDSTITRFFNDLYFKAIVGILDKGFRYPGTALLGLKFRAEGFDSIPRVSALLNGRIIRVPNNYNTKDRTYSGIWNGAFKEEYTNNPAWVFYDLITNKRYGCGELIDETSVDKFALYEVGQYCDEGVSDGRGGTEPRFAVNVNINNRGEAYDVLNSLAAAFRGMLYYAGGTIIPTQDKPGSIVKIFSPSNVIQEMDDQQNITAPPFTYEGTGRKARKTVALVSWNDPNDLYKAKTEYVEDRSAIEQYGYREIEVRGFGCTSQGQAQRLGRWILATNLTEKETVTFKTTAQGFFLMPGELIEIVDSDRAPGVAAGAVKSGSSLSSIVLDRDVTLNSGTTYRLQLAIGNEDSERVVTNAAGTHSTLTLASPLPSAPQEGDTWLLRETTATRKRYRVVGVNENEDNTVTVAATAHNAEKYDLVDNSTFLDTQSSSIAQTIVTPIVTPSSIVLSAN